MDKVLPQNASARGTLLACERSLKRLGTDRLDCYLLHWRGSYPLEETFAAFEQLRNAGLDPLLGREQLRRERPRGGLARTAGRAASPATRCSTTSKERAIEHAVIPWCEEHGVAVVAYAPYGHGDFPGPDSAGRPRAAGNRRRATAPRRARSRCASCCAGPTCSPSPRPRVPEHAAENAGAGKLQLSAAELERIDRAFPRGPKPAALPMI